MASINTTGLPKQYADILNAAYAGGTFNPLALGESSPIFRASDFSKYTGQQKDYTYDQFAGSDNPGTTTAKYMDFGQGVDKYGVPINPGDAGFNQVGTSDQAWKFNGNGANYGNWTDFQNRPNNYNLMYDPTSGSLSTRLKTGKTEATDTKYTKVGDYYIPTSQQKNFWDTNDHLAQNALSTYATVIAPAMPMVGAAMNAGLAASNGNWGQAAMSMLPAAGQYGQIAGGALNAYNASKTGNTMGVIGGLAGAAGGAANVSGNTDMGSMFGNVSKGAGVASNLQNGNVLGAIQGSASLAGYGGASQYAPVISALSKLYSIYNQPSSHKPASNSLGFTGQAPIVNSLFSTQQRTTPVGSSSLGFMPMMFGTPTGRG